MNAMNKYFSGAKHFIEFEFNYIDMPHRPNMQIMLLE